MHVDGQCFEYSYGDYVAGDVDVLEGEFIDAGVHTSLWDGLSKMCAKYETSFITISGSTCALISYNGRYAVVDSHARNTGGMVDAHGKSVVLFFNTLDDLFLYIRRFSGELHYSPKLFEISGVHIVKMDSSKLVSEHAAAVPGSSGVVDHTFTSVEMKDDSCGGHSSQLHMLDTDDVDDDVVVTDFQSKVLYFNPVSDEIARSLCGKLNVEFQRANSKSCVFGELGAPCMTEKIVGDGNCFFRALSQAISGTQKYHRKIRLAVVNQLQRNSHMYDSILRSEYSSISQYIAISRMQYVGSWATEVEIKAAADYFGVNIFTFCNDKWLEYGSFSSLSNHGLYLQNIGGNHYETVTCVKQPQSQTCHGYCMNTDVSGDFKTRQATTEQKVTRIKTVKTDHSIKEKCVDFSKDNQNTLVFTPICDVTAKTLCKNLKIDFEEHNFQKVTLRGPLGNVCKTKSIINDSNSFFRAVAYSLSGSEKNHRKIRLAVISHMTNNAEECERFLAKDCSVTEYINQSQMKYVGHCATEIEFKSAANMLGLDIYVFNGTQWTKYNSKSSHLTNQALYLQNSDEHFDVVICAKQGHKASCFELCEEHLSLKTQHRHTRSSQVEKNAKQTLLSGKANYSSSMYLRQKKNQINTVKYRTKLAYRQKIKFNKRNTYAKNLLYKEQKKKWIINKYCEDKTYQKRLQKKSITKYKKTTGIVKKLSK
ncbi:uncharacterized protein LOC129351962 [Poeciliopsis prolifica]|uniref:uncharacterized protein LOC129351962 n=1 Tax=Poeciliopsis prolifica TaxID=188132 RepID=UPI002413ECC3|nr:uncharacterized protein LOC129351962 [Poeciliopsis prolifica]